MVLVANLQEHVDAIDRAVPLLQRSLTVRPQGPPGTNKVGAAVAVLAALLGAWGAWRWSRYEPRHLVDAARIPPSPELQQLAGYRGFLAFVGLVVITRPLMTIWTIAKNAPGSLSAQSWETLTTPALPTYNPGLACLAIAELPLNAIFVAYSIAVAALFFTRRLGFRFHFVAAVWASLALDAADVAAMEVLHPSTSTSTSTAEAMGRIIGALIWAMIFTAYVRDSRRVRPRTASPPRPPVRPVCGLLCLPRRSVWSGSRRRTSACSISSRPRSRSLRSDPLFLTADDVLAFHGEQLARWGGQDGVRELAVE